MDPNQNNQMPNKASEQPINQTPDPVIPLANTNLPPTPDYNSQPQPAQPAQASPSLVQVNINTSQANLHFNKTYGILSLVFPFFGLAPIGLIFGILGLRNAKKGGYTDILSRIGTIICTIFTIIIALAITSIIITASSTINKCNELGPGEHQLTATSSITCGGSPSEKTY